MCGSYKLRKMRCPPASMLWGCSSGRLTVQGVHDPYGPALDYLNGGSRCIIANLWDVTDKDIDKLSMNCMQTVFECAQFPNETKLCTITDKETTVPITRTRNSGRITESLIRSRDVCKLKYAVGSAPVVYGVPTQMGRHQP